MTQKHESEEYRAEYYDKKTDRWLLPALAALFLLLAGMTSVLPQSQGTASEEEAYLLAVRPAGTAVGGILEIEEIWAIEDERKEASGRLITAMNDGAGNALGFDAPSSTFYCTLGTACGDEWPQIELSVCGDGVSAVWVDDYTYDFCSDAIREGYRYEIMAYTDTEYAYYGVVFTALPIITVDTYHPEAEIGDAYIPGFVTVSSGEYAPVNQPAQVHLRSGGFQKEIDKFSYRIEFHTLSRGKDKPNDVGVLGLEPDSDFMLISNAGDETCMRNKMSFDLWSQWNADKPAFGTLQTRMVEVFVQDEYMGLYQLFPRIRPEEEILRMGGNPGTDCLMRVMSAARPPTDRPIQRFDYGITCQMELRYAPQGVSDGQAFAAVENFMLLNDKETHRLDDETFARLAQEQVDVEAMMSYFLFSQVSGLSNDNVCNNLFIWILRRGGKNVYYLSPWDMDCAMRPVPLLPGETYTGDKLVLYLEVARRMLDLDVAGCRDVLWDLWQEKRAWLTDDVLYQWFVDTEEEINATGAYLRDSEKWYGEARELSLVEPRAFTIERMYTIDRYLIEMWPETSAQDGAAGA